MRNGNGIEAFHDTAAGLRNRPRNPAAASERTVLINRRAVLGSAAMMPLTGAWPRLTRAEDAGTTKADYTLRIANGLVELAPDHIVSTPLYNGQFPGPLLRFKEGERVVVDVYMTPTRLSSCTGTAR